MSIRFPSPSRKPSEFGSPIKASHQVSGLRRLNRFQKCRNQTKCVNLPRISGRENQNQTSIAPHLHLSNNGNDRGESPERQLYKYLKNRVITRRSISVASTKKVPKSTFNSINISRKLSNRASLDLNSPWPTRSTIKSVISKLQKKIQYMQKKEDQKSLIKEKLRLDKEKFMELQLQRKRQKQAKAQARQRKHKAATAIQRAFKNYLLLKRIKEYEKRYQEVQKRTIAAMKIQLFWRSYLNSKRRDRDHKEQSIKKVEKKMINYFTDYIITFKYLKPKFHKIIKQFDNLVKHKKANVVDSACVTIQYWVRKFLKKLRAKRKKAPAKKKRKKKAPWQKPSWNTSFSKNNSGRFNAEKQRRIKENLEKLKMKGKR
ncbi:unnamed protein product [Moneuplotes crassus]|uniref:Uncharacterized protein n=1 Tax=Euplotes crassus TaxID=5936 RepID=A0AAD1XCY5_EUPCR|nr:unnamed protein product [Moneuplotes crassus]